MPTILNIVLIFIAAAFIISGLSLLKDNLHHKKH
jgi:hypothetical protein